jgi:hypothetical protein
VLLNIGEGFEIPLGSLWLDPHSKQWHRWLERWLVIRSHALAARQIKGLEQRLQKAEKALTQFASKPGTDAQSLQEKVDRLLESDRVKEYLLVTINKQIRYPKVYDTPGRPGRGGSLPALPIYFQDEQRIGGLMFLLTIALRVLTLMEFVVRRQLAEQQHSLAGLYDGNPQRTPRSAELRRVGLLLSTTVATRARLPCSTEISPLNFMQQQILKLMNLPMSIYALSMPAPE